MSMAVGSTAKKQMNIAWQNLIKLIRAINFLFAFASIPFKLRLGGAGFAILLAERFDLWLSYIIMNLFIPFWIVAPFRRADVI